jgi:hypothetical protein
MKGVCPSIALINQNGLSQETLQANIPQRKVYLLGSRSLLEVMRVHIWQQQSLSLFFL